jgi:hypothetical protein
VLCPGLVKSSIYESEQTRPPSLQGSKMDAAFLARLEQVHKAGMEPEEVGAKVLQGIRRNDFYIFTHPEFRDELQLIFDEVLDALPEESAPGDRVAFEDSRRAAYTAARKTWKTD